MIRAIFLDVDGTLISFRTHEVPVSAVEALCRARERGVRLFIATGRAVTDLELLEPIPYEGVVALNGAECILRDGRVVVRHPIPREEFERALELSDEWDFPVGLELNEGIFVNRVTPVVEELARMEEQLRTFRTLQDEPYRLVPLPMPQAVYDEDGQRLPATYANFLIINGAVLMPTYGQPANDELARRALLKAFPQHEIVGIDCRSLIRQHGSLHCCTMQFPASVLQ